MKYTVQWQGNELNQSGIAHFKIEGIYYIMQLNNFKDYQNICQILDTVYAQGKYDAENAMRTKLIRVLNEGVDK